MAVTIDGDFTELSDADQTTGWTGRSPISNLGTDSASQIEGTACIDGRLQSGTGDATYDNGSTDYTNNHIYCWFRPSAPIDTTANSGATMRISGTSGGATNYGQWVVGGSDLGIVGSGGWINFTVDLLRSFDTTNGTPPAITAIIDSGVGGAFLSGPGMSLPVIDRMVYGTTAIVRGGTGADPGKWSEAATADLTFGHIKEIAGAVFINSRVRFGDSVGTTSTEFDDVNAVVLFETNMFIAGDLAGFEFAGNSTGTNNATFGTASGTGVNKVGGSGGTWKAAGDRPFRVEAKDTNMDATGIFGVTMLGPSVLWDDNLRNFKQEDSSGGPSFLDFTREANDTTANDASPFPAGAGVNDAVYFGHNVRWYELNVNTGTAGAGTYTLTWEYSTGLDAGSGATATADMAAEAGTIAARGSGYQTTETLTLSGGVASTAAVLDIDNVSTVAAQDETNYDGTGSNGTFVAGSSYAASDVNTMSEGSTITVDAVSGGAITQFTVTTNSTSGIATDGATITQSSTTGSGTGFTMTLGTNNQGVFDVSINDDGSYQTLPSNPVSTTTSGSGTGATVNMTWTVETVTVGAGGSGYTVAPNVVFSGGTPSTTAQATATLSGDAVSTIAVDNEGTSYDTEPTVTLTSMNIWASLTDLTDGTGDFKTSGAQVVSFSIPDDWATTTVDTDTRYWVRARRDAGTVTTDPDITQCSIAMAGDVELEDSSAEMIDCVLSNMGTVRVRSGAFCKRSSIASTLASAKHAALDLGGSDPTADTVRDVTISNNEKGILLKGSGNVTYNFRNIKFAGNNKVDEAWQDDGGSFTEETDDVNSTAAGDIAFFHASTPATGDHFYLGDEAPFNDITINVSTGGAGGYTLLWQYWNGSAWTAVSGLTDDTNSLTTTGSNNVSFTRPTNWARNTVNSIDKFWFRARFDSGTMSTSPVGTQILIPGDVRVDFGSGDTVTINILEGGNTPLIDNVNGSTVNVIATVDVDVHVEDTSGNNLQDAQVFIRKSADNYSYTSHNTLNAAGDATFEVNETVDTDLPQSSWLHVYDSSTDTKQNYRYAGWTGKIFTLNAEVTGSATSAGSSTSLISTSTNFLTADIEEGDTIRNTTDGEWAVVDEIVDADNITTSVLSGGASWDNTDAFSFHRLAITYDNTDLVDIPLFNGQTDSSGDISTTFGGTTPAAIIIRIRSNEAATKYVPFATSGSITSNGFSLTALLQEDTVAT